MLSTQTLPANALPAVVIAIVAVVAVLDRNKRQHHQLPLNVLANNAAKQRLSFINSRIFLHQNII